LRVGGEVEYAVEPLAEADAIRLFCDRSGLAPDAAVGELCRRLDSLPLAVELAAARASVLSPSQILDRLGQRLDLLKGGRDTDVRQQTLRATIEWSHDLLAESEKQLFARLAVFAGGCRLEAAEAVCDADLDALQSLVEKSLVRHSGERFWMLETIREYALEQLNEAGIIERHSVYYEALAEEASPHVTLDEKEWLDALEAEHDNLRAVLDRFDSGGDTQSALHLVGVLHRFWGKRGHFREAGERIERLLAADERSTSVRALALNAATVMAASTGRPQLAARRAAEALELHRQLGDEWGIAYSLLQSAFPASDVSDYEQAARLTSESLARFEALGDEHYARGAMANLGYFWQMLGDWERADEVLSKALEAAKQAGNKAQQAHVIGQLSVGSRNRRRFDTALDQIRESLQLWAEVGDPSMQARDLRRLARTLAHLGRAHAATRTLSASEAIREAVGHWETWIAGENDEILALIHAQIGPSSFDQAWTEGKTMTIEQALELAHSPEPRTDTALT
jgi:tetratricopeptide (TPR) repeat protein